MGWFVSALEVAHKLATLDEKMRKLEADRREALATYLEAVSDTLLQISKAIEKKERPEFLLGKLDTYGAELPEICKGMLEEKEAWKLARELPFHWPPGNLLEIHQPDDDFMPIDLIGEYARCAGAFKALAESIRAKR
jgi:hypothetical protein